MTSTQRGNAELVRRALEDDPDVYADSIVWHFECPFPEYIARFDGKDQVLTEWPKMLDEMMGGTFSKRVAGIWPVGDDMVVAHIEIEMTVDGVHREGSGVMVYRVADGAVTEVFDIPSASI